jgi:protein-tyrosine phosphatase
VSEAPTQTQTAVIQDVTLTRGPDGGLIASWSVAGDCDRVDVAWGKSPDGLDHEHAVSVDASSGHAILPSARNGGPARVYVSVGPSGQGGATLAGERKVGLVGPVNFRDLGGYRTLDGSTVRWGRVFRSDALVLHEQDVDEFAGLGIRTVYDLRSDLERTNSPNQIPDHLQADLAIEIVPLINANPDQNPIEGVEIHDGEAFLAQLYARVLDSSAPNFGRILTGLADEDRLPAVFHCMAGKDRTGMVAAVLLSILGVSEDDILADYELTGEYRNAERVRQSMARIESQGQLPPEVLAGILRAPRWAMQTALDAMNAKYGDFDGYLTGPGGADPAVPGELRRLLLKR